MAVLGVFSKPPKSPLAATLVIWSSATNLVFEFCKDPDSLKPIWPLPPMPKICKSIPPNALIFAS